MSGEKWLEDVPFDVKLIGFVLILLAGVAAADFAGTLTTDNFVEANVIRTEGNTIILGRDCRAIVAEATFEQAHSIRLGKQGRIETRPLTHDIFTEALDAYNITVEEAALESYSDGIYFGELVLRSRDRVLRLDVRPTDAVATALRTDTPVMLNETVLDNQGQNIC